MGTIRQNLGLLVVWASACGAQTAAPERVFAPPPVRFDYAPESYVSIGPSSFEERHTYSYDDRGRLVRMTKMHTMPETPRTVVTLSYGERDRLDSIVTETFWSVDPYSRETEVRRFDGEGRLARKEVAYETIGRNEPISTRTVDIERDALGRPVEIVEKGPSPTVESTVSYDDVTGHIAAVTDSRSRHEMTFDGSGRIAREAVTPFDAQDTATWSSYAYDSQGFVSSACEYRRSEEDCDPSTATVTFTLTRDTEGTPTELVKRLSVLQSAAPRRFVTRPRGTPSGSSSCATAPQYRCIS
jgi:hypothetical protein